MRRRDVLAGASALAMPAVLRAQGQRLHAPSTEELVSQYLVPGWYRDAKLGLWAHWGPQCAPEAGDWYGRHLYLQDHPQAEIHRRLYGHPADHGFIDVITGWKAENWDPDAIVAAFKAAGARFVVAMACHHDNFDLFPNEHHPWNSARLGPRRDIVGEWERAVRSADLPFGVSNHASHAWHWWQTAYGYDTIGPRKGERYDAWRLTTADGRGTAWEGLDPQQLYSGRWLVPPDGLESPAAMRQWHDENSGQWVETGPPGNGHYELQWLLRHFELVNRYNPDFYYQDGYSLPFGETGRIAAMHFYAKAAARTGEFSGVMSAGFTEGQGTIPNLERKSADAIRPESWQSASCIGDWHYNRARFTDKSYVPAAGVIRQLADVVSKNGTLLLSIPVRGDGTLDAEELRILDDLGRWMAREGEAAIYGSRVWRSFGDDAAGGVRYTVNRGALHALLLEPQAGTMRLKALGRESSGGASIEKVELAGGGELPFRQRGDALEIDIAREQAGATVPVLKIYGGGLIG
ncbi:MAG TPA: alpha-L-fucosidase [Sphingomonadaceae bacterium]|nr:alpha-L-fucosidase [Sphingomonadaceae bacterium]